MAKESKLAILKNIFLIQKKLNKIFFSIKEKLNKLICSIKIKKLKKYFV